MAFAKEYAVASKIYPQKPSTMTQQRGHRRVAELADLVSNRSCSLGHPAIHFRFNAVINHIPRVNHGEKAV
jgi:hypothetical protein